MKKSSKFSDALHILLHMADSSHPLTSEALAKPAQTNPVVVRRIMAGLREQGFVQSEKGHGGGWKLSCDLKTVTLQDVYEAIGAPTMFAMINRKESSQCLVEGAVNTALGQAFQDAANLLLNRFHSITLDALYNTIKKHSHTHDQTKRG